MLKRKLSLKDKLKIGLTKLRKPSLKDKINTKVEKKEKKRKQKNNMPHKGKKGGYKSRPGHVKPKK